MNNFVFKTIRVCLSVYVLVFHVYYSKTITRLNKTHFDVKGGTRGGRKGLMAMLLLPWSKAWLKPILEPFDVVFLSMSSLAVK
jgi:hypothetical protein